MTCHECPLDEATQVALEIVLDNPGSILSSPQRHQRSITLTARNAIIERVAESCDGPTEAGDCTRIGQIALIEQSVLSPETVLQDLLSQENSSIDTSQVNEG